MTTKVATPLAQRGFEDVKTLAVRFKQGHRNAYILSPPVTEMFGLVPERIDPDMVHDANRRLNPAHARSFGEYVWDREDWVSGALMLGMAKRDLRFEPIGDNSDYGFLSIPLSALNSTRTKLFDGQHRRFGLAWALEREREALRDTERQVANARQTEAPPELLRDLEHRRSEIRSRIRDIESESIPIIVYEESDIGALRQMFADAAKVRPPDPVTVAMFDTADPINAAAVKLAEEDALLVGRVEWDRSRLKAGSSHLITLNQLSRGVLRTLAAGI